MEVQNFSENQAAPRQSKPWVRTPLVQSRALSEAAGIFLKLDNFQPSGSFKSRGIGNYILKKVQEHHDQKDLHFYASSGGNAGLACVHAAQTMGFPATVVVPTSISPSLMSSLSEMGAAEIIQHGESVLDADHYLKNVVLPKNPNGIYVPPFAHQDIWDGNATVMDEIASQLAGEKPDVVICSVGGGGLLNGIMQSLDAKGWSPDTQVIAMETEGADSLYQSVKAREIVTLDRITSAARSLGVKRISDKTWEYAQRPQVISAALPDSAAARGCWMLAKTEKIMAELTVGINVILCYDKMLGKILGRQLGPSAKVVIVVCGGSDINTKMLENWRIQNLPTKRLSDVRL